MWTKTGELRSEARDMPTVCKRVWSLGLSAKRKREDERECWNAASGPKHDENAERQQNGWGKHRGFNRIQLFTGR